MHSSLAIACLLWAPACSLLFHERANVDSAVDDAGRGPDGAGDAGAGSKVVFVTSTQYSGVLGGSQGANEKCQGRAEIAGLTGEFKAWLGTATTGPAEQMTHHDGPYVLANGIEIAVNWDDLTDGSLFHEVARTEFGTPRGVLSFVCIGGEVWTNTTPDGASYGAEDCQGWTGREGATGIVGNLRYTDENWTTSNCPNVSCSMTLPLYCVEQ